MKSKTAIGLFIVAIIVFLILGVLLAQNFRYPLKFKEEIVDASQEFGIDKEIVASIINAESGFDEKAVSKKGAIGLMQIMPKTAEWVVSTNSSFEKDLFCETSLFEPSNNIKIGTCYFSYLLKKFENLNSALCAYNAGEGTVLAWLKSKEFSTDGKTLFEIPFPETKKYVEKVNENIKIYKKKFN